MTRRVSPLGLAANYPASVTLTGAESAGEAGTVTGSGSVIRFQHGPLGLTHKPYGDFTRSPSLNPTGAGSTAQAGSVSVTADSASNTRDLGPHGLSSFARQFSPKQFGLQNVNAPITGAQIDGEFNVPDSATAAIYVDGAAIAGEAGSADQKEAFLTTAAIAAQAGSVTSQVSISASVTGAESTVDEGNVFATDGVGSNISGAAIAGSAGTVTVTTDQLVSVTGAQIGVEAMNVGIDNDTQVDVVISSGVSLAQAGAVTGIGNDARCTVTGTATEAEIVAGGVIFTGTLVNAVLPDADTGPIGTIAQSRALIDGYVSEQSEVAGWNAQRANIPVTALTRLSDTQWTLTLPALPNYAITAAESLRVTVPIIANNTGGIIPATPIITLSEAAEEGTPIENPTATTVPSNYLICDRTGFKQKVSDGLKTEWTGNMVRKESFERRHPQDLVRSTPDKQKGSPRPEQEDNFITELVSADDL